MHLKKIDQQPLMNTFCNIAVGTNLTEGHVNQLCNYYLLWCGDYLL